MTPQQHQRQFERNMEARSRAFMERVMAYVRNEVILNLTGKVLHRRTGRLVGSITTKVARKARGVIAGTIGTNVYYGAVWETTGLPARVVVPRRRGVKALKIPVGPFVSATKRAGFIFRKKAVIPRQPARPFIKPAVEKSHPFINALHKAYFGRLFPKEPVVIKVKARK